MLPTLILVGVSPGFVLRGRVLWPPVPVQQQQQRGVNIAACGSSAAAESSSSGGDGSSRLNLLYDSKCAVCQWEVDNLQSLGCGDKITFTDLEDAQYDPAQNAGVGYKEAMERITAVTADGEIVQGLEVFARCYAEVGLGWMFGVTRVPILGAVLAKAYEAFAVVRTLLTRGRSIDALVEEREAAGGKAPSASSARAPDARMMAIHSTEEMQTAAALVLPLLAYKASAIVQRVQLQWYLDASIALAAAALIVYASS